MTRFTLFVLVAAATATGCVPEDAGKSTPPTAMDPEAKRAIPMAEVFRRPAPAEVADDPRVIALAASEDVVGKALTTIQQRMRTMRYELAKRAGTESDLKAVIDQMKPLTAAIREDCDALLRASKDLKTELGHAPKGYAVVAELYRERAARHTDKDFARILYDMAAEFNVLAQNAPCRLALTEEFILHLQTTQEFLAEADRFFKDASTALGILTAGGQPPEVSEASRAFRRHLAVLIEVVNVYRERMHAPPMPIGSLTTGTPLKAEAEDRLAPKKD